MRKWIVGRGAAGVVVAGLFIVGVIVTGARCAPPDGAVVHSETVGSITVWYWQIGKHRLSRTGFEFDFGACVLNEGGDVMDLVATVGSGNPATEIVDGEVRFGAVSADSLGPEAADGFTIVQDREVAFDPGALTWRFMDGTLPPDPGAVGNATLAGIDSDGDGVRDDVQRFIEFKYPDSLERRTALKQVSRALQGSIVASGDREKAMQAIDEMNDAIACAFSVLPDGSEAAQVVNEVMPEVVNTRARFEAKQQSNRALGNATWSLSRTDGSLCDTHEMSASPLRGGRRK